MIRCEFCQVEGHHLQTCTSPKIEPIIRKIEAHISYIPTRWDISKYIQHLPSIQLKLISRSRLSSTIQISKKEDLVEFLTAEYYKENIQIRNNELNEMFSIKVFPVSNLDFTKDYDIQHTLLDHILSDDPIPDILTCVTQFYISVHYANVEQNSRYSPFIDTIYRACINIRRVFHSITKHISVSKHCSIATVLSTPDSTKTHECPICMNSVYEKECVMTECKHTFCNSCFRLFLQSHVSIEPPPVCPLCRESIHTIHTYSDTIYAEYVSGCK